MRKAYLGPRQKTAAPDRTTERRKLQQILRCPAYTVGDWVLLKDGRVCLIRSLQALQTEPGQRPQWSLIDPNGRRAPISQVRRLATEAEVREQRRAQA